MAEQNPTNTCKEQISMMKTWINLFLILKMKCNLDPPLVIRLSLLKVINLEGVNLKVSHLHVFSWKFSQDFLPGGFRRACQGQSGQSLAPPAVPGKSSEPAADVLGKSVVVVVAVDVVAAVGVVAAYQWESLKFLGGKICIQLSSSGPCIFRFTATTR